MAALNRTVLHSTSNFYELFDTYKTYKNKSYTLNLKAEIDQENTVHIFVVRRPYFFTARCGNWNMEICQ